MIIFINIIKKLNNKQHFILIVKYHEMSFLEELKKLKEQKFAEQLQLCIEMIKSEMRENVSDDPWKIYSIIIVLYDDTFLFKKCMKQNIVDYFREEGFSVEDHFSDEKRQYENGIEISFKYAIIK